VSSLQGSLATVDLPEVLGLLVATAMSGELFVGGDRTKALARVPSVQGRLWLDAGCLAAADVAGVRDPVGALVALLWLTDGTFTFEPGQPPAGGGRAEVADVLRAAMDAHAEWREIERVLPSQQAWLELNPVAPPRRVTLTAEQWRVVVAVGGGESVAAVVDRLGAGELGGCRAVKDMVEAGLVTVRTGDAAARAAGPPGAGDGDGVDHADGARGLPSITVGARPRR
jgi:hypothetical protein